MEETNEEAREGMNPRRHCRPRVRESRRWSTTANSIWLSPMCQDLPDGEGDEEAHAEQRAREQIARPVIFQEDARDEE
jgi:hypothetical protein